MANYTIWGDTFPSLKSVARDPRCEVSYDCLWHHLRSGMSIEDAVKGAKPIVCWGESFDTVLAVSKDHRCRVSYENLIKNLSSGMTLEQAVLNFYEYRCPVTINQCIKQKRKHK